MPEASSNNSKYQADRAGLPLSLLPVGGKFEGDKASVSAGGIYCGANDVAALAFSLDDDSDSEDSLHQFLSGSAAAGAGGGGSGRLRNPLQFDDDTDDGDAGMLGTAESPYGAVRTRPPSPCRPISAAQLRTAASEPATSSTSPSAAASGSASRCCNGKKKMQKRQSPESLPAEQWLLGADDSDNTGVGRSSRSDAFFDSEPAAAAAATFKRPRLVPQAPLSDATNCRHLSEAPPTTPPPPMLSRCMSEHSCSLSAAVPAIVDTARIDNAIASIDSLNLIGNSQQGHALPTVKELDYGIRYVSPGTVAHLLAGRFADRIGCSGRALIVDCRYPYEFAGGHIRGAVNIYRPEDMLERLLRAGRRGGSGSGSGRVVIIFHCEFSSERAPRMARLLRQRDREANADNYPQLHYPELYLLQGGYKAFYELHKADCDPTSYTRMADPAHKEALAHYHRLGKAWERQNSRSKHSRLQSLAAGSPQLM